MKKSDVRLTRGQSKKWRGLGVGSSRARSRRGGDPRGLFKTDSGTNLGELEVCGGSGEGEGGGRDGGWGQRVVVGANRASDLAALGLKVGTFRRDRAGPIARVVTRLGLYRWVTRANG